MSKIVKLRAGLPADFEMNGLDSQVTRLLERPKDLLAAVVWLDVSNVVDNIDEGTQVPVVRVRRIEPLGDADAVSEKIRTEVNKAIQARTGRTPVPWDIVEVLEGHDPDQLKIGDDD